MSRIFLSHSSRNNAQAIALCDWLSANGWGRDDIFLDIDATSGISPGERWQKALNDAAGRCEAVVFLISREWLESRWCHEELALANKLNKRLFGILIDTVVLNDVPARLRDEWQLIDLESGRDGVRLDVELPNGQQGFATFSASGLGRLRAGLVKAGLDPRFFAWPPVNDLQRAPYRGLAPMEAEDAGIFYGREAATIAALDQLRGLAEAAPPRLMVVLGASGAGKSSFMRAGLIPRLMRNDCNFFVLPILRPERAAITGKTGLITSIAGATQALGLKCTRAKVEETIAAGTEAAAGLLFDIASTAARANSGAGEAATPAIILPIDQAEELFVAEGQEESQQLLALVTALLKADRPKLIALATIRTDSYEKLQLNPALTDVRQLPFNLPALARGAYQRVIEGPAERLAGTNRALKIEPALTAALLADIEEGGAKDALPLLAFTLERLFADHGGDGDLTLAEYEKSKRIAGAIEAAVERALADADGDPGVPKGRTARLALLRRAMIPWLAGIDPDTRTARRQVARFTDIPDEARPLMEHFVEQRLLATDVSPATGERTIEPSHEALLRQWTLLDGWLKEDIAVLGTLEGVRRAARDWDANNRDTNWLAHAGGRLEDAEAIKSRIDLARRLDATDLAYLDAARAGEAARAGRELEEAGKLAEAQRVVVNRTRLGAIVAACLALVSIALAYYGLSKANEATLEAQRSNARAELAQAQFALKDSPRLALTKGLAAVGSLRSLGVSDDALASFYSIVGTARELPQLKPYSHSVYNAERVAFFVKQSNEMPSPEGPPGDKFRRPFTVVGGGNFINIIDDSGKATGAPISSPDDQDVNANDAAWIDANHFVVATGDWDTRRDGPKQPPRTPLNAALRIYDFHGHLVKTLVEGHDVPFDSVVVINTSGGKKIILAGDRAGRIIVVSTVDGLVRTIPTGLRKSVRKIAAFTRGNGYRGMALVFGAVDLQAERRLRSEIDHGANPGMDPLKGQQEIRSAAGLDGSAQVAYIGQAFDRGAPCAASTDSRLDKSLILCEPGGKISVWDTWNFEEPRTRFSTGYAELTAVAMIPDSPLIATASKDGKVRIWLKESGTLVSEMQPSTRSDTSEIDAVGFIDRTALLLTGETYDVRTWDIEDIRLLLRPPEAYRQDPSRTARVALEQMLWPTLGAAGRSGDNDLADKFGRPILELYRQAGKASRDGRFVFASNQDHNLDVIDLKKGISRVVRINSRSWLPFIADSAAEINVSTLLSDEIGGRVCTITNYQESKDEGRQTTTVVQLAMVTLASGKIERLWSPADGIVLTTLAGYEQDGRLVCVAGSKNSVYFVWLDHVEERKLRPEALGATGSATINAILPGGQSDRLLIAVVDGRQTRLSIVDDNLIPEGPSIAFDFWVSPLAYSSHANRIICEFSDEHSPDRGNRYRLLGRNLETIMSLPEIPAGSRSLHFSDDGTILRGVTDDYRFQLTLDVATLVDRSESRLQKWSLESARTSFLDKSLEAADWDTKRTILEEARKQFPNDPTVLLLSANAAKYRTPEETAFKLNLYGESVAGDPYNPMAYYVRGKVRASQGDQVGAADDFDAALALPHYLPNVRVIAGILGINEGIAALSWSLQKNAKAEIHLRLALALSALKRWDGVLQHAAMDSTPLAHELAGLANANLGKSAEAVAEYRQALELLGNGEGLGLDEYSDISEANAWRYLEEAALHKKIGDLLLQIGNWQEATTAFETSRDLLKKASAATDATDQIRRRIAALSADLAKESTGK